MRNTLAVQRNYVKQGEERQTDFISIIAYGKNAEHISKFYNKGSQILINGEIRTGSYDKEDGTKVYTTDVVVNRTYFCESKKDKDKMPTNPAEMNDLQFEASLSNIPSLDKDDSLPF